MDNSSFNRKEDSVSKIIEGSNQAYYGRFSEISGRECEVKESLRSYIPYALHYNPRFVYFLPHFYNQERLILQTI